VHESVCAVLKEIVPSPAPALGVALKAALDPYFSVEVRVSMEIVLVALFTVSALGTILTAVYESEFEMTGIGIVA
jgi:hypothetical protein